MPPATVRAGPAREASGIRTPRAPGPAAPMPPSTGPAESSPPPPLRGACAPFPPRRARARHCARRRSGVGGARASPSPPRRRRRTRPCASRQPPAHSPDGALVLQAYFCRWLLTCWMLMPSTSMICMTPLGVAISSPPSRSTASTNRLCSWGVQRRRCLPCARCRRVSFRHPSRRWRCCRTAGAADDVPSGAPEPARRRRWPPWEEARVRRRRLRAGRRRTRRARARNAPEARHPG